MKRNIKRIWNGITTVLVALMILLAAAIWGVRLVGMDVFVVQSGSMEPAYPVGALVYVKETEPARLEVGDVITYNLTGSTRATHRIVELHREDGVLCFKTKGDANEQADSGYVAASDIVGKVLFSIPSLGYLVAYIQSPPGLYVAFSVVAVILILIILPDLIFDDKKKSPAK